MTKRLVIGKRETWQLAQIYGLDHFIKTVARHFDLKENGTVITVETEHIVATSDIAYDRQPNRRR